MSSPNFSEACFPCKATKRHAGSTLFGQLLWILDFFLLDATRLAWTIHEPQTRQRGALAASNETRVDAVWCVVPRSGERRYGLVNNPG